MRRHAFLSQHDFGQRTDLTLPYINGCLVGFVSLEIDSKLMVPWRQIADLDLIILRCRVPIRLSIDEYSRIGRMGSQGESGCRWRRCGGLFLLHIDGSHACNR